MTAGSVAPICLAVVLACGGLCLWLAWRGPGGTIRAYFEATDSYFDGHATHQNRPTKQTGERR